MGDKVLELKKWDASSIKPFTTMAIFAPRSGGKSFLVRDILYKNQGKWPAIVVICPSEPVQNFYKNIIPDIFIFDELNADTIESIKNMYKRQTMSKKKLHPSMTKESDMNLLIIMDDCMGQQKKYLNHLAVKDLYKMGRHF